MQNRASQEVFLAVPSGVFSYLLVHDEETKLSPLLVGCCCCFCLCPQPPLAVAALVSFCKEVSPTAAAGFVSDEARSASWDVVSQLLQ